MESFSLIVPTVNRTVELERLLGSLEKQDKPFQVIIVDQNADDRLAPIVRHFRTKFDIAHIRSSRRGAARARNVGLEAASGDIITFPDDDCWYPGGLLREVRRLFLQSPAFGGFSVRGTDAEGCDAGLRWSKRPAAINRRNIWRTSTEWSVFLSGGAVDGVRFNEELGVGADTPWGAGEGTDFLLRILGRGQSVQYEPRLFVHHPSDPRPERIALNYARGLGRVLRLNGYSPALAAMLCLGPLLRAAKHTAQLDSKGAALAWKIAMHRWAGFRAKL